MPQKFEDFPEAEDEPDFSALRAYGYGEKPPFALALIVVAMTSFASGCVLAWVVLRAWNGG